jgi:hypothetical protein
VDEYVMPHNKANRADASPLGSLATLCGIGMQVASATSVIYRVDYDSKWCGG